jgi:diphthamide synthase (EF-2-diphthine--ammonia ligase)
MTVLRVVALISGGKDSIFNCMNVLSENHQIVALANLHPKDKGEFIKFSLGSSSSILDRTSRLLSLIQLKNSQIELH